MPVEAPRTQVGNVWGNADPVEAALADAIGKAAAAGEWGIVGKLAGELEARRLARVGVPSLAEARARRRT